MASRLVRWVCQLGVKQLSYLFDRDGRLITFEIVNGVRNVPRHVRQDNAPVRGFRPRFGTQRANESAIGDLCPQNLTCLGVVFDLCWNVKIPVVLLSGVEHAPILASFGQRPCKGYAPLLFHCAKTVSELDPFHPMNLLLERKQIPRIVVNVRTSRKPMEPLEPISLPWAQGVGRSNRPAPTNPSG
jgi:hypothetical protein